MDAGDRETAREELRRVVGPQCAAAVLYEVDAIARDPAGWLRAQQRPPPVGGEELNRAAELAAELADTLRRWLGDAEASRRVLMPLATWMILHDRAPPGDRFAPSDIRRELDHAAGTLDHVAQWARHDAQRRRRARPGPAPDPMPRAFLGALAWKLAEHGLPLASGDNATLVRAARPCWRLLGWAGSPRDVLRSAIKVGAISLPGIVKVVAAIGVREIGGGITPGSAANSPPGGSPEKKRRKSPP